MKTLINLDEQLPHHDDDASFEDKSKSPTYRKMMLRTVGQGLAKDGDQAIDLVQIGLKLRQIEPNISLEDAEFKVLKTRCSENPSGYYAHYHGLLMLRLRQAEGGN